jgi:hypothetical protein
MCWYTDGRLPCRCEVRPHSLCGWHVSFRMYTFETTHDLCWRTIPSEGSFYVSGAVVVGSFMFDTQTLPPNRLPVKAIVVTNRSQFTPSFLMDCAA